MHEKVSTLLVFLNWATDHEVLTVYLCGCAPCAAAPGEVGGGVGGVVGGGGGGGGGLKPHLPLAALYNCFGMASRQLAVCVSCLRVCLCVRDVCLQLGDCDVNGFLLLLLCVQGWESV